MAVGPLARATAVHEAVAVGIATAGVADVTAAVAVVIAEPR